MTRIRRPVEGRLRRFRTAAGHRAQHIAPPMRRFEIQNRPDGDDPVRIDRVVAVVIVAGDVVHEDRVRHARHLIQRARVIPQIRIIDDAAAVALEVAVIDRIEPHQRGEQTPVGLGHAVAHQEALVRQPLLQPVERIEQRVDGIFVGFLRGGETGFVDAVIHRVINPRIHGLDGLAQVFGPEIQRVAGNFVESRIKHPDDFRAFIRHDGRAFLVPQDRHRDAPGHQRIGAGIDLVQEVEIEQPVARRAGEIVAQFPAVRQHVGMHDRDVDVILQPLERPENKRAVRPGAGIGHIQVVAPAFSLETTLARGSGRTVRRDPVAPAGFAALEFSARAFGIVPFVMPAAVDKSTHHSISFCVKVAVRAGWSIKLGN